MNVENKIESNRLFSDPRAVEAELKITDKYSRSKHPTFYNLSEKYEKESKKLRAQAKSIEK